ncbi:MAG: hypothetical protein AB1650_03500 [Candidatus Omnitrophota bacterium]
MKKPKTILVIFAFVAGMYFFMNTFVHTSVYTGDPLTPGALSGNLLLTLIFKPKDDCFRITLQNISGQDFNVRVNAEQFQGSIVVIPEGEEQQEFYGESFRTVILTGVPVTSVEFLKKGDVITWNIPVAELHSMQDKRLTRQELYGSSAYAKLGYLAIVPPDGGYIGSNAEQVSERIGIK